MKPNRSHQGGFQALPLAGAVAARRARRLGRMVDRHAAGPAARGGRRGRGGTGARIGADRRAGHGRQPADDRRRRPQGPLLARSDGPRPALRQARQEPVHGHEAGAGLRRRGRGRAARCRSARGSRRTSACARSRRRQARSDGGFSAPGTLVVDERTIVAVQARVQGYVEKLHVRATYDSVRAGQPLAELYVPEWLAAQEELLALKGSAQPGAAALVDAARARLGLLGMPAAEIARVEREGRPSARVTITAPQSGVVWEIGARDGMAVMQGTTLFRLAGLGSVWVDRRGAGSAGRGVADGRAGRGDDRGAPRARLQGHGLDAAARGQRRDAHGARAHRARQSRRLAEARDVRDRAVRRGRIVGEAGAAGARRGGDPHRQAERRDRCTAAKAGTPRSRSSWDARAATASRSARASSAGSEVVASGQFMIDSEASLKGVLRAHDHAGRGARRRPTPHADHAMPAVPGCGSPRGAGRRARRRRRGADQARRDSERRHGRDDDGVQGARLGRAGRA